jgi:hypothetical protein
MTGLLLAIDQAQMEAGPEVELGSRTGLLLVTVLFGLVLLGLYLNDRRKR